MENFVAASKKYLLDTVLLSVARLLPILVGIFGLNEVLAATHPFNGFSNFVSVFGFDTDPSTAIAVLIAGVMLAYLIQSIAENYLDQERVAHRHAYQHTAPQLRAEKSDLAEKLKEARDRSTTLTQELETERKQHMYFATTTLQLNYFCVS